MQGTLHLPKPKVLLLTDMSYQLHRAASVHPQLQHDGVYTGGLFGFMSTLARQIRECAVTRAVVCMDMSPYVRSRDYPDYKLVRKKAADPELKERVHTSKLLVQEFCNAIGLPAVGVPGFEADDCMAMLTKHHLCRFDTILLGHNDSDSYQLLNMENVRILKGSGAEDVIGRDQVRIDKRFHVTPDEYVLASCLQGTHNDVEGIQGVGPVSAYKALRQPEYMAALRAKHNDVIERNMRLARLPHAEMPRLKLPPRGNFDARALYRFADRYGIEVTMSMRDSFEQISG